MLHTVCYISNAVRLWQNDELNSLFAFAEKKNILKNVTGLLLYNDGTFVQVLEGESETVHSLIQKIKDDARHNQITIMMDCEIEQRLFNGYKTSSGVIGDLQELKKIKSRIKLPKASKYTKSLWAILRPFYVVRTQGIIGYGL